MRIFRKKKKETDNGKRVSYTQGNPTDSYSTMMSDGEFVDAEDFRRKQKEYDWLVDNGKAKPKVIKFGKNREFKFRYKPNELFSVDFYSKNVLDSSDRLAPILHKSTKKEPIRKVYRDFLKESEKVIKAAKYKGDGTVDKELREAIKKEIRRQHKIKKIKNISKVALPVLAAGTTLGIVMKNKKKKDNN